jgi:hypothetical protein
MLAVGREQTPGPWFDGLVDSLTGVAIVGGTAGLNLEPVVEAGAVEPFAGIAAEAGARLRALGSVTETDAAARRVAGHPVIWRRLHGPAMPCAPIADLAQAMVDLVRGQLPKPPPGTWWYIGLPTGRRTLEMRGSDDG